MRKLTYLLVVIFTCSPLSLFAQEDSKYLAGAVPEVDGKVVFTKAFDLTGAAQDQIFERMLPWITERMKKNGNESRVVYTDKGKGMIAAMGEEYLVFSSSALSLDRTIVNYQVTIACQPGKCIIDVEKIRYTYQEKEKYVAEEWITDKYALNKTQTKMVRGLAKFRTKTIDFVDGLFDSAQAALGIAKAAPVIVAPISTVAPPITGTAAAASETNSVAVVTTPPAQISVATVPVVTQADVAAIPSVSNTSVAATAALNGYKQISADKIPGNIIKMLNDDWMLITAGNNEKFNMMTASWGGLGVLFGKPIATCFINPARFTYQLMEKNDTYTLTFYTEAYRDALKYCGSTSGKNADKVKGSGLTPITTPEGSKAFSEAWLIIECRKLVSQSLTPEAISNEAVREEWTGKQLNKMFIGEIINVWVK